MAITKYAAFQLFEENTKGSIEKGRVADFVILSENPFKTKRENLLNIKVVKTIKSNKDITEEVKNHLARSSHLRHFQ